MANAFYIPFKQGLLGGAYDLDTDDIRCILLTSGYTFADTDEFVADLTPGTNEVGRSTALQNPTVTGGVFDADNIEITSLTPTDEIASIVIFKQVTNDADSPVILYIDTATGLPLTLTGTAATIAWSSGANKIFKAVG